MNFSPTSVHKTKVGTCPHGLPLGACPICSGMGGGGGGGGSKKVERPAGEMSWDECVAVGQMLKAQKLAQQKRDIAMQAQLHAPLKTTNRLETMAQTMADFAQKLSDFVQKTQSAPKIISKPIVFIAQLVIPAVNILKNIPILAQKTINFVKEKLNDISDKLNAVFGELKTAIEKKISDRFKDFRKKNKSLFTIFEPLDVKEEKIHGEY